VCTNVLHTDGSSKDSLENFIVSTPDIWSNKWSDPVCFDFDGIDPSIFFDDDGKSYMQGSASPGPMTKIHLFEIDLQTGKKLSAEKKIWDGTGEIYPEGPHMFKKDSWYYIMISEGGTHENHMITVARSRDIWGPYEPYSQNPILTARGTDEYIRHTGHSDMFQDQSGQWWGVCLGVRKDGDRYVMGRETFLTTGEWAEGEWPKMSQVKMNPDLSNGTKLVREDGQAPLTAEPMVDYLYIRDAKLDDHKFSSDGKSITLTASKGDISQWREPVTFVGKRQRKLIGTASLVMHRPSEITAGLQAGLAYYKDEFRYMKLFYDFSTSEMIFEVVANNARKISETVKHQIQKLEGPVALRVEYTEGSYKFSYRIITDAGTWVSFDARDTVDMTAPDFVGPVIGCFAQAETGRGEVRFENLEIE
jgi:beta-xylosidase